MIILAPSYKCGEVHIQSCKCFETIKSMQDFLESINTPFASFSLCPYAFEITEHGIKAYDDEFHSKYVFPHTYNSRKKAKTNENI